MNNSRRFNILMRDGFRCTYCGKTSTQEELEVDHIIPKCQGGGDEINNLTTACRNCNQGKSGIILLNPNNLNSDLSDKIKKAEMEFENKFNKEVPIFEDKKTQAKLLAMYFVLKSKNHNKLNIDFKALVQTRMLELLETHHPWHLFQSVDWVMDNIIPKIPNLNNFIQAVSYLGKIAERLESTQKS